MPSIRSMLASHYMLWLLILSTITGFSQEKNTDYYRKNYQKYYSINLDSAYYFAQKLLKSNIAEHDTVRAKDFNNVAIYYKQTNQKDSAIYFMEKSLPLATSKNRVTTRINLATIFFRFGEFEKAAKVLQYVLTFEDLTTLQTGNAHASLASLYNISEKFEEAKFHFEQAQLYLNQANDLSALAICETNFANFYNKNQLQKFAIPLYQKTSEYFLRNNDNRNYNITLLNLSSALFATKEFYKSKMIFNKIELDNLLLLKDNLLISSYYAFKAKSISTYTITNNPNDSIEYYFKKGIDLGLSINNPENLLSISDYIEYLSRYNAAEKIKEIIKGYKIDSTFNQAPISQKIKFLTIVNQSNLASTSLEKYGEETLKIYNDSLVYRENNTVIKDQLTQNTTDADEKPIGSLKIVFLTLGSVLAVLFLIGLFVKRNK
ncbi:MAG: hypothetical protein RLZZ241_1993 [Bacteroidota bacterium]